MHNMKSAFGRAGSTGRVRFCQLSTPSPEQQPCGKQVRSCQSNGRLQQEETGLNRCEQLPTAALRSLRIHCATPQSVRAARPDPLHPAPHQSPGWMRLFAQASLQRCVESV